MSSRIRGSMVMLASGLLLASCASAASLPTDGAPVDQQPSLIGTWVGGPEDAYLQLNEDGTLVGFDGCNNFGGTWAGAGETLELGEIVVELVACDDPEAVLAQASTARREGSDLVLLDASGTKLVELTRENP